MSGVDELTGSICCQWDESAPLNMTLYRVAIITRGTIINYAQFTSHAQHSEAKSDRGRP